MSYRFQQSHCKDPILCPDGNCIGCKNGVTWCHDPRCDPYCTDCTPRDNQERFGNMVILIILVGLLAILGVFVVAYSPNSVYYYRAGKDSKCNLSTEIRPQ